MSENQPIWINWARTLEHWGVNIGAAYLLEAAGSLNVLFAQLVYISQPMLSGIMPSASLGEITRVLENPADRLAFVALLRKGIDREPAE